MYKILSVLLIVTTTIASSAQQAQPLSRHALEVKRKADSLSSGARISVLPAHAEEEFGTFTSSDAAGFTFYDVDRKVAVTLTYEEVRKIKDGYGGYNSIQRRHTDHTKGLIVAVVVVGVLGGLIAALATAKN